MKKLVGYNTLTPRDGDGGDDNAWRESLAEDIKTHQSIKDTKDVASLAKQFVDQQKYLSGSIRIPGEDAGDEDWSKFHTRVLEGTKTLTRVPAKDDADSIKAFMTSLGMPENKDGYTVDKINIEGLTGEDARVNLLRDLASEAGMTQTQFEKMATKYLNGDQEKQDAAKGKIKESRDALMTEWGMAFDARSAEAISTLKKTGAPEGIIKAAEEGKLGGETLKWAYTVAKALGSESNEFHRDDKNRDQNGMSPDEAKAAIREIQNNPKHPYYNHADPGNKAATEKIINLHRMANPEKS